MWRRLADSPRSIPQRADLRVGGLDLLEAALGFRRPRVVIRVVGLDELSVYLAQLGVGDTGADAQSSIWIRVARRHGAQAYPGLWPGLRLLDQPDQVVQGLRPAADHKTGH